MPMLKSGVPARTPGARRGHMLLALLLWGGVTIFIFGILVDLIR
jgi:hypothetical protein